MAFSRPEKTETLLRDFEETVKNYRLPVCTKLRSGRTNRLRRLVLAIPGRHRALAATLMLRPRSVTSTRQTGLDQGAAARRSGGGNANRLRPGLPGRGWTRCGGFRRCRNCPG